MYKSLCLAVFFIALLKNSFKLQRVIAQQWKRLRRWCRFKSEFTRWLDLTWGFKQLFNIVQSNWSPVFYYTTASSLCSCFLHSSRALLSCFICSATIDMGMIHSYLISRADSVKLNFSRRRKQSVQKLCSYYISSMKLTQSELELYTLTKTISMLVLALNPTT